MDISEVHRVEVPTIGNPYPLAYAAHVSKLGVGLEVMTTYPTKAQLRALKKAGWSLAAGGLAWHDPIGRCFYAPRRAVAVLAKRAECHNV